MHFRQRHGRVGNMQYFNLPGLRAAREAADLSVRELADLAEMSAPHVSRVERGLRRASTAAVFLLAEALGIDDAATLTEVSQ